MLAFTSVYFFEMSLFNGLWVIGVKKFRLRSRQPAPVAERHARRSLAEALAEVLWPVAGLAVVGFFIPAIIGLSSALSKTLSTNSEILLAASPHAGSVDLKRRLSARRARRRPASLLREPAQPRPAKPGAIVAAQVGDLGRRSAGSERRAFIAVLPVCRRRAPRRGPLRGRPSRPHRGAANDGRGRQYG
jgi:hypothetical protein